MKTSSYVVTVFLVLVTSFEVNFLPKIFAQEKHRKSRHPVPHDGIYEGEFHFRRETPARVQGMSHYGNGWSKNSHLLWDGKVGDDCKLPFHVLYDSEYDLKLQLTLAPDYGKFRVLLDGNVIAPAVDTYSQRVELAKTLNLGKRKLKSGTHELVFKLIGANEKAVHYRKDRYLLGLDYMQLTNLDPEAKSKMVAARPKSNVIDNEQFQIFVKKNCLQCHGANKQEAELDLRIFKNAQAMEDDLETTHLMAQAIEKKEMPPEDVKPQPGEKERQQAANFLKNIRDEILQKSSNLPTVVMRRLNRLEYSNSVRDLLNLKGDIYPLPEKVIRSDYKYFDPASGYFPDQIVVGNRALGKFQIERPVLTGVVPFAIDLQAEHGFNNRGVELSVSPLLLETFLKLGNSIVNAPEFSSYCRDYKSVFEFSDSDDPLKLRTESRRRIKSLLFRAFRRPISDATLDRYHQFFLDDFQRSHSFSKSMKKMVSAILASPHFLFIQEAIGTKTEKSEASPLSDFELATRLSFFLWNTIPDRTLLELAREGKLSDPKILAVQVHNMLLDPKSEALAQNFARQWLRLDQLITAVPDDKRFPRYYSRIGCEFWKFGLQTMMEPLLLFESIMIEDRSIMELIDSDYSFRSRELQSWYDDKVPFSDKGIVNRFNTGRQEFIRRQLGSRREGGVMTTAATMTMTSSPLRTSPIIRGAWVATVILNQPPPPPPDVVPEIEADDAEIEKKGITLRQRLKQHQENQSCASCHAKIDPLGFALENYDAVGRWRDTYRSGLKIDSSGKLFGKHEFKDVVELKDVLVKNPKIFTKAFAEHLLSYALARELTVSDKPAIDRIVRNVIADEGRFSRMIMEVANSYPFRHKSNPIPGTGQEKK